MFNANPQIDLVAGGQVSKLPRFDGFLPPSNDFDEIRKGFRRLPDYFDIALDNARSIAALTALVIPVAANSFYIDQNPTITGNATIHFQDSFLGLSTPIYVSAGFLSGWAFTQLIVENAAQPGKILRVIYGTDIKFIPAGKL
jgi:hypothetical protein